MFALAYVGQKTTGEAQPEPFIADPAVGSSGPERSELKDRPFFSPGTHTHSVRPYVNNCKEVRL